MNKDQIYETIIANYDRMITYNRRESVVLNKMLTCISAIFDVLWSKKYELAEIEALGPLLENASSLLKITEERSEVSSSILQSMEEFTQAIKSEMIESV